MKKVIKMSLLYMRPRRQLTCILDDEPWAEGLSEFRADKEEDYLSPDF